MKKILLTVLLVVLVCGVSYGEVSYDVSADGYATKGDIRMLSVRIDAIDKRIDDVIANTNRRIDDLRAEMNGGFASVAREIDGLAREIDSLRHVVYWGIALLGLFLGSPIYGPVLKKFFASFGTPAFTREDVEKIIDAKLSARNN